MRDPVRYDQVAAFRAFRQTNLLQKTTVLCQRVVQHVFVYQSFK